MPHIHAIALPGAADCLARQNTNIRKVVAKELSYDLELIALIPRVLNEHEAYLADNMLPLELVIDIGAKPDMQLDDKVAENLRNAIAKHCSCLRSLNFAVWVREMQSNGFAEYTPTK